MTEFAILFFFNAVSFIVFIVAGAFFLPIIFYWVSNGHLLYYRRIDFVLAPLFLIVVLMHWFQVLETWMNPWHLLASFIFGCVACILAVWADTDKEERKIMMSGFKGGIKERRRI
jgi:hypothetical protein